METLYNLSVMFSAIDRFTGPVRRMAENLNAFEKNIKKATAMIDFGNRAAVSGALVQGAADKVNGALFSLLQPTVAAQRALGELSSVGIRDLKALEKAAADFTATWSGTTEAEFISSAYDIKSGISALTDAAVAGYTRMAALTAKATKAAAADMTALFATGYGIYKDLYSHMTDMQFGEMFSAGIAASVQSFKTTGPQMSQALTTLGAAAATAQRPFEEQLAVLGMLQATMPGSEAGTKYKAFVQTAAKAGTALGLSFVDSNNQLLGMTEILDRLRGKYGETLDAMEKQQIQKAFGTQEAVALIDLLYGKVGQLRGNVDQLGMSLRDGIAFTENMAAAMNDDLGAGLDVINQNVDLLKDSIGGELAPLIKMMIPHVKGWVQGFKDLTEAHPTLVRTALLLAAVGGAGLAVLAPVLAVGAGLIMLAGYVAWSWGQIGKAWLRLKKLKIFQVFIKGYTTFRLQIARLLPKILTLAGILKRFSLTAAVYARTALQRTALGMAALGRAAIRAAATYLPPLIAGVWSFTAALLANPITWVVLGIIALGAALYLLWRNWDAVTEFLGNAWEALLRKVAAAREWFAGVFEGIVGLARTYGPMILAVLMPVIGIPMLIAQNWEQIKVIAARIFGNLAELIPQKITEIIAAVKAKGAEFLASGQALLNSFADGIKSVIGKPAEVVKEGLAKVRRLLPFSDAKEGPLSTLTRSGRAFVETVALGMKSRSGYLQTVAAGVLAGAVPRLPETEAAQKDLQGRLSPVPRVNFQSYIRETFRERESTHVRDRRPVIVIADNGQKAEDYSDVIDMAYRYLETWGDD